MDSNINSVNKKVYKLFAYRIIQFICLKVTFNHQCPYSHDLLGLHNSYLYNRVRINHTVSWRTVFQSNISSQIHICTKFFTLNNFEWNNVYVYIFWNITGNQHSLLDIFRVIFLRTLAVWNDRDYATCLLNNSIRVRRLIYKRKR